MMLAEPVELAEGNFLGGGYVGELAVDVGVECLGVDLDLRCGVVEHHVGLADLATAID